MEFNASVLTKEEIIRALPGIAFTREAKRTRAALLDFVQTLGPLQKTQLAEAIDQKTQCHGEKRKRKNITNKLCWVDQRLEVEFNGHSEPDISECFQVATPEVLKACIRAFREVTSNHALELGVCTVCAQELLVQENGFQRVPLRNIPNLHHLVPKATHPMHETINGHLLVLDTIQGEGDNATAHICEQCWKSLSSTSNHPPKLSLANQMWIGSIPWQLQALTFSKQLLIAFVYPGVFVFKLYPRRRTKQPFDPDTLQRGMKGNVSSYEMNIPELSEMIEGNLMPRPPQILG
ncbi:hypothetical protein JB92DRAFT_3108230 [Gautieria morchelliformis]|nr:hypothetical protein JB92DRAFT_3108230 [Gautieria morchelliformis]